MLKKLRFEHTPTNALLFVGILGQIEDSNFRPQIEHLLFNSSSTATAQKPLPLIRHICGLGASVGCERVERTFTRRDESHKYALSGAMASSVVYLMNPIVN